MSPQMRTENEGQEFVQLLTGHQTAILSYIRSLMPGYPGARDIRQHTNTTLQSPNHPIIFAIMPPNVPHGPQVAQNFPLRPSLFRSVS